MSAPVIFLLIVLGGCVVPRSADAAAPTNADDAAAMKSIANSTGAAKSLGWGVHSPDPCDGTWYGVRCDDTGRVTAINASRGGLSGVINAVDLGWLASLSELDLSFNDFSHQELPLLHRPLGVLRSLDLRSGAFQSIPGGFFTAFPALEDIAIDGNDMLGLPLPQDVLTCSRLRSFSANNVNMHSTFPNFFGNASLFPDLESLSLRGNSVYGYVGNDFGNNSKIKFLDVSAQEHDDDDYNNGLSGIVEFFTGMENIEEVHLDHNDFYGKLPDATHLVNLRRFNAANNVELCGIPKFPAGTEIDFVDGNPKELVDSYTVAEAEYDPAQLDHRRKVYNIQLLISDCFGEITKKIVSIEHLRVYI
ncbi:hypothetical protein ACP4OV_007788 [Aristida adscensionis]